MGDIPPLFDALWFRLTIGLVVGLALGSFTTMLSYRLPRKLSIVLPPSHCSKCKAPLQAMDLIPVLSWLMTHGKCRHCGASIGARYLWIELATGIASATAFTMVGFQPWLLAALAGIVALVALVTVKIET